MLFVLGLAPTLHAQSASDPDLRNLEPFVMIIVDSSGSMERRLWKQGQPGIPCECETRGCLECLPACPAVGAGERNRWASILETLTGSFDTDPDPMVDTFQCTGYERTWSGAYDSGYFMPYHQPWRCNSGQRCTSTERQAELTALVPARPLQKNDGLLDQYSSLLRFGVATFDGIATWTNSSTGDLVPAPVFSNNLALSESERGQWSYAGPHRFHYPNCPEDYMMDTGIRSAAANANNNDNGGMISVNWAGCANPPCDTNEINNAVQQSLLNARSYGGTPIAAALDDLYYHYKNDLNDTFGTCRDRYAILISDGEPDPDYRDFGCNCKYTTDGCPLGENPDDMLCPYPLPEEVAADLVTGRAGTGDQAQIKELFVVGVAIPTVQDVPDYTPRDRLEAIAIAGGSTALFPTSQADLFSQLNTKLTAVSAKPATRSVPAFTANADGSLQYQISTGFQKPGIGDFTVNNVAPPWTGIIERQRIFCTNNTVAPQDVDRTNVATGDVFQSVLNSSTGDTRNLWSVLPDGGGSLTGTINSGTSSTVHQCGMASADRNTTYCDYKTLDDLAPSDFGLGASDTAGAANIRGWMYGRAGTDGGNQRVGKRLGDIYHSSPVVPRLLANADASDLAYGAFLDRDEVKTRPLTMYVGTNDGILHAFSVEDWDADTVGSPHTGLTLKAGEEMWGFVPPMKLGALNAQLSGHQFSMDGTPVVKDVYFQKAANDPGDGNDYATVLITGMRRGGNGYIALDITDPLAPRFLWQFAPPEMGFTYGKPAIAQLEVQWDPGTGTVVTEKRAVAVLPGGSGIKGTTADCGGRTTQPSYRGAGGGAYSTLADVPENNNSTTLDHRADVACWKSRDSGGAIVPGNGRALYFVDVLTGQLIKEIRLKSTGATAAFVFPSPIIGSPTVYPDAVGATAEEGYVVDADGVIWRIDFSSAAPGTNTDWDTGWTVRPFHDIFHGKLPNDGEVSYEIPILSVDDKKRLVVLVGTGDSDNFDKPTVKNRVVSLTRVDTTPSGQTTTPDDIKAAVNWEKSADSTQLPFIASELVTGGMALFQGRLFFATFISVVNAANACSVGRGRLWSVDYRERDPADDNGNGTFGPKLINLTAAEADATRNDTTSGATFINTDVAGSGDNLMIFGLGATQPPPCLNTYVPIDGYFSNALMPIEQTTPPSIWIVAQAFGATARANSQLGSLKIELDRPASFTRIGSWAGSTD